MSKSLRNKLTVILLSVLILTTACFAFSTFGKRNVRAEIFTHAQDVTVTKEQSLSSNFLGGRKGYMFSTARTGASVSLSQGAAGLFSIEFTPYSSTVGETEFNSFTFNFNSESARLGFSLAFSPDENGIKMGVSFTNAPLVKREMLFEGSFDNTSDKAVSFSFDPALMRVYNSAGVAVADFKSAEYMKHFDMVTLVDSYERYSVDMVFGGIAQGKQAKVIVFELCGQKFDGAQLINTSAPVIFTDVQLSAGVAGKAYNLTTDIPTFDVKDGFKQTFEGEITVTDGLNNIVNVENNVFQPSEYGVYYVNYTPVDSDNLAGKTYSYPIYVFESQPEINFEFKYPLNDITVGMGTQVSFGTVTSKTELSSKPLAVKGQVKLQGQTVYTLDDCAEEFIYKFDATGVYTVEFSATDFVGYTKTESITVTVNDCAIFKNVELKNVYARDDSVSFKSVYAFDGAEMFNAQALVTYPDGKTNDTGIVSLDQEGLYSVKFTATVNGALVSEIKYFAVRNDNVSLWRAQEGLTVTSNAQAPSYADDNYCGTMLTATRPLEALYNNVIDLSDNTSDDTLVELFIAPTVAGVMETSCIDIIFTDVHNREKVLDIRLCRDAWKWDSMKDRLSIIAQPKRDFDLEYLREVYKGTGDYQRNYYYGQNIIASLYGKIDNNNESSVSQSVKLYLDYETGKVYANMATKGSLKGKICVVDLADETQVGTGNAWKKFTTGEVELSVKLSGLTQTANLMILNIDGQDMSGTYTTDTTPPSIFVDYAGNSEKSVPFGIEGKPYKIFSAYSRDIAEGLKNELIVNVYRDNGGVLTDVENNGSEFVPESAGEYVIRYKASDVAGNVTVKDVRVTVKQDKEISLKNYKFNENLLPEVFVGSKYSYLSGVASGGTGVLSTKVTITKNGQTVVLDENNCFIVEDAGEYLISVVVSDYIGESQPFVYTINASYSDQPIITKKTMPKAIIKGEKYTFPEFTAVKYSATGEESVDVEYWVNGVKLEGREYTPQTTDALAVQIKAGQTTLDYTVNVTDSKIGTQQFLQRYFYTNATQKVIERSATFTFSQPAFVSIIKPVSVDFAKFAVSSEVAGSYKPGENLSRIDFTLTDAVYPDISFTAGIYKKDSAESILQYNGNKYVIVDAVFGSYSKNFQVEFDKETNMLIIGGKNICQITHCDNGDIFHGFKGESVYLEFNMPEVDNNATAAIGILNFAGQSFDISKTSTKSKLTSSAIKVLGDFNSVEIGEQFVIPAATAFDFMGSIKSLTVTVTAPDGSPILDGVDISEQKVITANWCGNYKILYEAKNSSGQTGKRNFSIAVLDRVPPVITLSGEVQKAGIVNKQINLPKMDVEDENTAKEEIESFVYVIAPNATGTRIENYKFTPDRKGTYTVVYYAADADKAIATKIFYIFVG